MKHVRNEELLPFHKLTEEEQQILEGEVHKGNVERLDIHCREWYQNITRLYSFSIYRTISQEEQEMQHEENNEFPWHMVSSKWNAVAKDKNTHSWYLFNSKPIKGGTVWCGEVFVEFDKTVQNVIGVDMSKWMDIPWEDSLMLRPGYEQQDTVEPAVEDAISDEGAPVVGSSSTEEYPVVKLKHLRKCSIGDVVRLKKTGELIEVVGWDKVRCSGCKFFEYQGDQYPCYKCTEGLSFTDYKEVVQSTPEPQDETFANTEMKVYADLDSKTKELLSIKREEGKVEYLYTFEQPFTWLRKIEDYFCDYSIYRVV